VNDEWAEKAGYWEDETVRRRSAPTDLWAKLKPIARQMRHDPTPAEVALWERLRNRQVCGMKFRRQHAIERFIVDFYCSKARLIVEVDGGVHDYTVEEDAIRQEYLESLGHSVLRYRNDDVLHRIDGVIVEIAGFLSTEGHC
jgi:very-short-patch-repair endonuclease